MRLTFLILALAAIPVVAPPLVHAVAAELPDMKGKWTATSRAVVAGSGGHYGDGDAKPRFAESDLTIEWTEQNDGRLIGTLTSQGNAEPKLGVVASDGATFVTVDSDGTSVGRIIDDDRFELCYTQSSAGAEQMVASCAEFARVKE